MIISLGDQQHIVRQIFVHHIPWCFWVIGKAADAQALALAQGVKTQAHMLANGSACFVFDGAGFFGNITIQKIVEAMPKQKVNVLKN